MRLVGWLIIVGLVEALLLFAWFMPTPKPEELVWASGVLNFWTGPPVPIEPNLQAFGLYVACPLLILAAYLIDRGER